MTHKKSNLDKVSVIRSLEYLKAKKIIQIKTEKKKIIEVRLFDEKRQKISIGDEIEFSLTNDLDKKILVKVIGLSKFKTFKDLYSRFHYSLFGHPHGTTLNDQLKDIMECYSKEEEEKYKVFGIHIELIE